MDQTTDAAVKVAATLAAEIIRRKDTLTAEQVGTIAHALGIDPGCDGTLATPSYMLFCSRDAGHELPHEWVEHPCPASSPEGRIGDFRCTRSEGHPGGHEWSVR